ncbi:hypothetical protein LY78DRAFT_724500, partial [Colletotrichum sublineola]
DGVLGISSTLASLGHARRLEGFGLGANAQRRLDVNGDTLDQMPISVSFVVTRPGMNRAVLRGLWIQGRWTWSRKRVSHIITSRHREHDAATEGILKQFILVLQLLDNEPHVIRHGELNLARLGRRVIQIADILLPSPEPDRSPNHGDQDARDLEGSPLPGRHHAPIYHRLETLRLVGPGVRDVRHAVPEKGADVLPAKPVLQLDDEQFLGRGQVLGLLITLHTHTHPPSTSSHARAPDAGSRSIYHGGRALLVLVSPDGLGLGLLLVWPEVGPVHVIAEVDVQLAQVARIGIQDAGEARKASNSGKLLATDRH